MELSESAGIDNLEVTGPPVYTIQYRLAVHRSQEGFRDQLNHELNALIDTDEYRELQNTWLRHERQELSVDTVFRYVAPVVIPGGVILLVAWVWTLKRQVARQTEELAKRSAELQAQATEDALTGLANRRLFTTIAEKEFPRAQRRGEVFSVLFLDLDHFKAVNDTYGHPVGDRVLEEFARRASKALRDYDTLARYGGEEFVALLRDADRDEALGVAKRVWTACRSTGFEVGEGQTAISVTTSIGVAVLSRDDQSFHQVLRRADEALYRAKKAGRDRVLVD
jgi:diguanylate cyclase (GGDEF)-like protein